MLIVSAGYKLYRRPYIHCEFSLTLYVLFYSAVPDYAELQGNTTLTVSTDPITGRSDVTYTYNVTSHWSSLAVVKSVYGQLTKELATGDTVVDSLSRLFTDVISTLVSALCSNYINVHMYSNITCNCVCLADVCMCMPCSWQDFPDVRVPFHACVVHASIGGNYIREYHSGMWMQPVTLG